MPVSGTKGFAPLGARRRRRPLARPLAAGSARGDRLAHFVQSHQTGLLVRRAASVQGRSVIGADASSALATPLLSSDGSGGVRGVLVQRRAQGGFADWQVDYTQRVSTRIAEFLDEVDSDRMSLAG